MAANLLVSLLGVPVSDGVSIDISPDRHVQQVFSRLGFVPTDGDNDLIVLRAPELSPEYPGVFDMLVWEVGRETCPPENPKCSAWRLRAVCPVGLGGGAERGRTCLFGPYAALDKTDKTG
ncbi:MAG: hypothetical protein AB2L07_00330 [Thermoanaerobaculaceae bacterium]